MIEQKPVAPKMVAAKRLKPAEWNPRLITDARFQALCRSIQADPNFMALRPVLAQSDGTIYAGNMRYRACVELGWRTVPAILQDVPDDVARERMLRDNNQWGDWQEDELAALLYELRQSDASLDALGFDDGELERLLASVGIGEQTGPDGGSPSDGPRATLSDRFLVPPFSVLDARQGYWQERKRQWLALGIQSELGRGDNMLDGGHSDQSINIDFYARKRALEVELGRETTTDEARNILVERGEIRHVDRSKNASTGLLGFSEQARSHYKGQAATVKGAAMPDAKLGPDGKTVRGDGRGRSMGSPPPHGPTVRQNPDGTLNYNPPNPKYTRRDDRGRKLGESASLSGGLTHGTTIHPYDGSSSDVQSGTSIFDPVLCEIAYRWFCPPGGAILDPFAGGSVRGIVASVLERGYTGIDLSERQIEANREQAKRITPDRQPRWIVGDSTDVQGLVGQEQRYDLIFSCPPYADLERYSDDPRDLSTMEYSAFVAAYGSIIAGSAELLDDDRFACFVVGDVRADDGFYRCFIADTIRCFEQAGLRLYNDAVLVTAVGSLPIRVGKQFSSTRKLGKTHQNVLVFCKGDPRRATEACGDVDVTVGVLDEVEQLQAETSEPVALALGGEVE